ncbi:PQQ-dependent sugar dehydrogenase [Halosegnis rubeus]|jgi:glucose/arabinose dehydrogenase|uniref:PQQ-dependent sugar dehydrogenase n=1 Tax=Halosegnis rubeus TaxID=2212850 RepID=A0A5N5ULX5_9EURY|nr:PQQ-dependent sugar dehydrogenase [Halosegnis rubeus]KAB7515834.1 PQQ-dependent sugar dehydrogenase [Halosegnis rubeus]KAB7519920.1 PQQ-dependent sugar dehydrogenase [Halosegnis rubeus]
MNGRTRRELLAGGLTVGLAGLAGCANSGGDGGGAGAGTPRATDTPTATPTAPTYDTSLAHDATAWDGYDPEWTAPTTNPEGEYDIEVLVENLDVPWDLSFVGERLFITERTGRVRVYDSGTVSDIAAPQDAIDAGSVEPGSDDASWFVKGGEGGTMGVAAHPNYPEPPLVYVYYTVQTDDGIENRLAYLDASADDPAAHSKVLLTTPAANIHNGGRIAFGPANYLWVTTGDANDPDSAADPASLAGKILRVTPEGEPAPDNPGFDAPEAYTMGHRNPQGIDWLPDATPIIDEHGPGPDEVNRLVPGEDYGWPEARRPESYAGTDYHRPLASGAVPQTVWAPSGATFHDGDGPLAGRYLVGALAGQQLVAFTLTREGETPPLGETGVRYDAGWLDDEYTATSHTLLTDELGRIRHVETGPDGALYAITSNRDGRAGEEFPRERDDVLVRITAA